MVIKSGSIESSDIYLEHSSDFKETTIKNLVTSVPDEVVKQFITEKINLSGLGYLKFKIVYNGANEWVINSRLEYISEELITKD